jgi:hypothetical protein
MLDLVAANDASTANRAADCGPQFNFLPARYEERPPNTIDRDRPNGGEVKQMTKLEALLKKSMPDALAGTSKQRRSFSPSPRRRVF